jgi:hypothetical protein
MASAQPNNLAAADARTDQPCNNPEPGEHSRRNDQHLKRGESNTKKIENSPHNLRFKISSLQHLGEPRSSSKKNASLGVFPLFPGAVQAASKIFLVLRNPPSQALLS